MAAAQFIVMAFGLLVILCHLYIKFDHSGWDEHSNPSEDALITEETIGKLNTFMSRRYHDMQGRNYYKRKITFKFSDGFCYTSYKLILPHDAERIPFEPLSPQWCELRQKAVNAHKKAVQKRAGQ